MSNVFNLDGALKNDKNIIEDVKKTVAQLNKDARLQAIEELNKKYSVILIEGQTLIMKQENNREIFIKPGDFRLWHKNKNIWINKEDGGKKKQNKADIWLEAPERNEFNNVVFKPGVKTPKKTYNLWKGFAFEPKEGDWDLMQNHIHKYLCNQDDESFKFFLKWCACVVHHCLDSENVRRPEVAIVLKGIRGIGKDTFTELFGSLFGRHFQTISQKEHLLGKFNAALQNCVLCHASETFWAGDKQAEGQLKALITNKEMHFEAKYRSNISLESHISFIISSNENWVVPAGAFERRFFVPTLSMKKPDNIDYFKNLRKQFADGGAESMLFDLINNIEFSHDDFKSPPKTQGLKEQIEISLSLEEKFWLDCLECGEDDEKLTWGYPVSSKTIYNKFKYFCEQIGHNKRISTQGIFIKQLNKISGNILNPKPYYIDYKTVRGVQLPDLIQAKQAFNDTMGIELIEA